MGDETQMTINILHLVYSVYSQAILGTQRAVQIGIKRKIIALLPIMPVAQ